MHATSVRAALASVFQIPLRLALRNTANASAQATLPRHATANAHTSSKAAFSTSSTRYARRSGGGKPDRRISKFSLSPAHLHLYPSLHCRQCPSLLSGHPSLSISASTPANKPTTQL